MTTSTGKLIDHLSQRHQSAELMYTEVPEWGTNAETGDPFRVWFKAWTLNDERAVKHFVNDENPEGFAAVVVKKALDEDGNRVFEDADRLRLMRNTEAHVIKRIAMHIIGATIGEDEAGKN